MLRTVAISLLVGGIMFAEVPKVGEPAPKFSLRSATGETVSLVDYAGKSKVVLVFYRGYW
jgi:peroxiredoxin